MEPYYYSQMDKFHRSVYQAIKTGLTGLCPSFTVAKLDGKHLSEIFFKLRLDCPEIFYAVSYRYRYYPDSNHGEMIPEYLFEKGKIKEHQKAMKSRVERLARPARELKEQEKELYIHDFICSHVLYDKLKKPCSHEIIGPLGQGVGVCEGIAKTVKILCDELGIWCIIAVSEANPEKNIKYRHAWNIVRIGGKYYHLDATFDNSLSHGEVIRYDYFNLDDRQFFRDHEPVIYGTPQCSHGDHFYYREKKMSFTKMEDVEKRVLQAVKKGKPLIFHWRGGYLTREVLSELLNVIRQTGRNKDMYARISLNWPQAVLQVSFSTEAQQEQVIAEDANEGEK